MHHLSKLRCLNLSNDKQELDFSCFPDLEEGSIDWNGMLINLNACKLLRQLTIWKYKPKSKSFAELNGLGVLESLKITQSNIESFAGIESLYSLSLMEGYHLYKLKTLTGIEGLTKTLKTLILERCKKLLSYESSLIKLKMLEKLILADCGELNSLNFINKMNNLKFFSFVNTNIKNGDLSPLKDRHFDYVGFDDKRHYSYKMKEIDSSFSWNVSKPTQ